MRRSFGRSGRGQGPVFVKLVRHTAQRLRALGESIHPSSQQAPERLEQTPALPEPQRARLPRELATAMRAHAPIRTPSKRLTHGQNLRHGQVVQASDPPLAPMMQGKSHGPAPFGRKPGIVSDPATGLLCATLTPKGNPGDPRSVLPVRDKVQEAMAHVEPGPTRHIHSVAGDLGLNEATVRHALHARCMLSVGMAKTIAPLAPNPRAQEVCDRRHEAGVHRKRTPHQVP